MRCSASMKACKGRAALVAALGLAAALLAAPRARAADDDAQKIARAEKIVHGKCFICHGIEGETSSQAFPRLAGQHAKYLARQLADFQSGRRTSGTMKPMVDGLTSEDFVALGVYFETRPAEAHPVADEALARSGRELFQNGKPAAGVAACAGCHGPQGHGTDTLPRLAGQHALYIENQIKAFIGRERTNDNAVMQIVATGLSDDEVKAVAAYISGLK
jgi:cytochrome c553